MNRIELDTVDKHYAPYDSPHTKMKVFHSTETGETIVIIFNPNIVGITKLKDFLTLKADNLRNVIFWWKGRDVFTLDKIFGLWRTKIDQIS